MRKGARANVILILVAIQLAGSESNNSAERKAAAIEKDFCLFGNIEGSRTEAISPAVIMEP